MGYINKSQILTVSTVLRNNIIKNMSHSFNKIWIHAIWSTKERLPLIHPTIESKLYNFIWQTGYAAYSVSEFVIAKVINYIQNQKQHHSIKLSNRNMKNLSIYTE